MYLQQAREIIKNNYPPENYTMLRDALDWLLLEAETLHHIRCDSEDVYNGMISTSDLGECVLSELLRRSSKSDKS